MKGNSTNDFWSQFKYVDNTWKNVVEISMFGREKDMEILMEDPDNKGINDIQKESYESYLKNLKEYESKVPNVLLSYFLANFEEIDRIVSLTDDAQKDTIVAERIFKMFMILSLYIDREGNYGWICKFSWEKNGLAILLSESEPRIITPIQLCNLNKLNDDTFGLLVHDGMQRWLGLEQNQFYGESGILQIEVEGGYDEEISPIQQKAYKTYLKDKEAHFKDLTKMMLTVYLGDEKKADAAMKVNGVTVVDRSLLPKTLYIDKEGNYGWICYSSWDDKYLGVLLSEKGLHVMRTNELLSYAIYKRKNEIVMDNVFGILFNDYMGYEKTLIVKLAGRTYTLPLTIRADDAELTDEMRSAYKQYLKLNSTLWEGVKDAMLEYYLRGYDWFSTFMDFPEELSKENVNRDNVMSLVKFTKLYISDIDGRIAWLCECPTAEEEGLAFEFTDGNIEAIAQTDII